MVRKLTRAATALALSVVTTGCVRGYRPPSLSDPHALLVIRRIYGASAGTDLDEQLLVNGRQALSTRIERQRAETPRTDAVRLRPIPNELVMRTRFWHRDGHGEAVDDGTCERSLSIAPETGHVYLVDYVYRGAGECSVACVERPSGGSGASATGPCPQPEASPKP